MFENQQEQFAQFPPIENPADQFDFYENLADSPTPLYGGGDGTEIKSSN